jgi:hypothetical protein
MKIVPIEPTAEMITAGATVDGVDEETAEEVWEAMVAAAPQGATDSLNRVVSVTRTTSGIQSTSPFEYMQDVLELRQAILDITIPGPGPFSAS